MRIPRRFGTFARLVLLCGSFGLAAAAARAQQVRDVRIDPHPARAQVGIVTRVLGRSAWIKLPENTQVGAKVEFIPYSDGGDTLYVGRVAWVAPVAPYEAYVTELRSFATRHSLNDYESISTAEAITRETKKVGSRPETDGGGVDLAIGFFARVPLATRPPNRETVEPVRAHIRALRALQTVTARAIADAATRSLNMPGRFTDPDIPRNEAVNYQALSDSLRRFRRLAIADPVTDRLLRRLLSLAEDNGNLGEAVSTDFLRKPSALPMQAGQQSPRP